MSAPRLLVSTRRSTPPYGMSRNELLWNNENPDPSKWAVRCTSPIISHFLKACCVLRSTGGATSNVHIEFELLRAVNLGRPSALAKKWEVMFRGLGDSDIPEGFRLITTWNMRRKQTRRLSVHSKATGRFCTRCGAILDVQTAIAMQDEIEGLDEKFSMIPQDEDVQKPLMKKMIELGIK